MIGAHTGWPPQSHVCRQRVANGCARLLGEVAKGGWEAVRGAGFKGQRTGAGIRFRQTRYEAWRVELATGREARGLFQCLY